MITGINQDGKVITVAIDLASTEDVKQSFIPNLTSIKVLKPVAAQFADNHSAVFVKTEDGNIHVVSVGQFSQMGLNNLNLPTIIP
jgi:hypothetical protein